MSAAPIFLADLRPDGQVEADLRWYFNAADGEIGLRSNYAPMVAKIETGPRGTSSVVNRDLDERCVRAAGRARLVQRALQQLTEAQRLVLLEAYREQVLEDACGREALQDLAAYGPLAGLVALSPSARQEHATSHSTRPYVAWLARLARPNASAKARTICAALRREAEARLAGASRAYTQAARAVRRRGRYVANEEPGEAVRHG